MFMENTEHKVVAGERVQEKKKESLLSNVCFCICIGRI